ncbi:MAG: hypothetical protein PHU23_17745 [Dehalococcoidales bacterium]|nr:hypothetical protein [Dehalococcoidales bacterium]
MEKTGKRKPRKPPEVIPTDYKILQELKTMNDILREIREILDNTWRGRKP